MKLSKEQELYFANAVIGAINNVDKPMLIYDEEKEVVKRALRSYIMDSEDALRGN